MSKATEVKLESDHNEAPDRRRGMRLIPSRNANRNRNDVRIGISSNIFSESSRVQKIASKSLRPEKIDEAPAPADEPSLKSPGATNITLGATIGGVFLVGLVGYFIGRRRR